jgi:hypothetical protein
MCEIITLDTDWIFTLSSSTGDSSSIRTLIRHEKYHCSPATRYPPQYSTQKTGGAIGTPAKIILPVPTS